MLGYSTTSHDAYVLLRLRDRRIIERRDVDVHETIFPFKTIDRDMDRVDPENMMDDDILDEGVGFDDFDGDEMPIDDREEDEQKLQFDEQKLQFDGDEMQNDGREGDEHKLEAEDSDEQDDSVDESDVPEQNSGEEGERSQSPCAGAHEHGPVHVMRTRTSTLWTRRRRV